MEFYDGQLLTADDINKYLVNRKASLDLSSHQSSLDNLTKRVTESAGALESLNNAPINFPGWITRIEPVAMDFLQSPTNAGNTTGTPGWKDQSDYVKANTKYFFVQKGNDDILKCVVDTKGVKYIDLLEKKTSIAYHRTTLSLSDLKQWDWGDGFRVDSTSYETKKIEGDIFSSAESVAYGFYEPKSEKTSIFTIYLFGKYDPNNLPILLVERA